MKKLVLALAITAAHALLATTVHAQTPTVITSLPYTISAKGSYVLTADLSSSQTSGSLIEIAASNVTIDFQGHYISGVADNTSQSVNGIYAYERSNLTIRNGTIANCYRAVCIDGNGTATSNNRNHSIDGLRLTRCVAEAVFIRNAPASSLTNSKVSQIGYSGGTYSQGIEIIGSGVTVQNCAVSQLIAANSSYGIRLDTGSFARQNTISDCTYGVTGGKYQDNLTANITQTAFQGGTNAGGNN